jgi:hypothetical protein
MPRLRALGEDCEGFLQACIEQVPDDVCLFAKALGDIACDTDITRGGRYKAMC